MDDGWCGVCQTTTDGECIHYEDGTTIPRPREEIRRLREALHEIAYDGMSGCINYESGRFDCHCKKCIARHALEGS